MALCVRKVFCAVRIASCALPTCTTLCSESETFAAPAFTLAIDVCELQLRGRELRPCRGFAFLGGEDGVVRLLHLQRDVELGVDFVRLRGGDVRLLRADVGERLAAVEQRHVATRRPVLYAHFDAIGMMLFRSVRGGRRAACSGRRWR